MTINKNKDFEDITIAGNDSLFRGFVDMAVEHGRAKAKWPDDFKNYHEAYAVILEEIDELWDEIKKKDQDKEKIRKEAVQSAAMLLRLITELT